MGMSMGMSGVLDKYLPQFVYGGTDGIVTTFAILAGAMGARISRMDVLAIGVTNLIAAGFSLGVSSYLSKKSEKREGKHSGVAVEESVKVGIATFVSFVMMGLIPIIPMVLLKSGFMVSSVLSVIGFIVIGYIKGTMGGGALESSVETSVLGILASALAFITGHFVGN